MRLVLAGVLLPLLGFVFGDGLGSVLFVVGGICLLAGLVGYATQRE